MVRNNFKGPRQSHDIAPKITYNPASVPEQSRFQFKQTEVVHHALKKTVVKLIANKEKAKPVDKETKDKENIVELTHLVEKETQDEEKIEAHL